jgi:calreticulin
LTGGTHACAPRALQRSRRKKIQPHPPPAGPQDPKATKPADWDERPKIPDPEDKKPAGWDDIPATIADPDAKKPEDWDDEDDGEWEPPMIPNPEYKGEWKQKM